MDSIFSLEGKAVVLTGGFGMLGRSMCGALLNFGANLVVMDCVEEGPGDLGQAAYIRCDLASSASARDAFRRANERFGKLDVLINNAAYGGGAGGVKAPYQVEEITDEAWNLGLDGTLGIVFRCVREAVPYLEKSRGSIVNIASMYGMIAPDHGMYGDSGSNSPPAYGAGKAAVLQLTRYLASYLAPRGIRVNSITPGPFPFVGPDFDTAFLEKLQAKTMLGRTGRAEELSGALVLLASGASSYMTGSNIVVDGGMTAW